MACGSSGPGTFGKENRLSKKATLPCTRPFSNSIQREHLEELKITSPNTAIVRFCSILTGSDQAPNGVIRSRKFLVLTKRDNAWKISWGQNTRLATPFRIPSVLLNCANARDFDMKTNRTHGSSLWKSKLSANSSAE